jgi:hypothetical protein
VIEQLKIALFWIIPFTLIKLWPYQSWCRNGLKRFSRRVSGAGVARATTLLLTVEFVAGFAGLRLVEELVNPGGQWQTNAAGQLHYPTPSPLQNLAGLVPIHWIVWSMSSWQIQGGRTGFSLTCGGDNFQWRRRGLALSLITDLVVYAAMFLFVFF